MEKIDADVDSFFSKFDDEEIIDMSEPLPGNEEKEVETKKETKEVINPETNKEDTSEKSDKDKSDDEDVPFHKHPRFKEINEEKKSLREEKKQWEKEKQEYQERLEKLENKPLSDDELNNMTPKEIQEYTRKQIEKDMKLKQELSTKEKTEADKYINEALSDLKDAGHEFDENKLLTLAEKYTEGNIEKAFDLYQQLGETSKEAVEKEKIMAAKKKAAEGNKGNKGGSQKTGGFISGTSWGNLDLK